MIIRCGIARRFYWPALMVPGLFLLLSSCTPRLSAPSDSPANVPGREPRIKVALAENLGSGKLLFKGNYALRLEEADYRFDESIGELEVSWRGGLLILRSKRRYLEIAEPQVLVFRPDLEKNTFTWNNVPYSGELQIDLRSNGVAVINHLPLETYLQGVVPFEIPTGQPEYEAAVYAQAITARSFALYRLANPVNDRYHIRSSVQDQLFLGVSRITPLSDRAIRGTRGFCMAENDKPVITQYHSTCGGVLLPSDNSRGAVYNPQVREESSCRISPLYRWVEQRDVDTISRNVGKVFDLDSSEVNSWIDRGYTLTFSVAERDAGKRVTSLTIKIDDKVFRAEDYQVRRVLANKKGEPLPGNLFFVNRSEDDERRLFITGAGSGHGKGMCQWGAVGMSIDNKSYSEILGFYYPGLALKRLY